jgi:hypothetical protein
MVVDQPIGLRVNHGAEQLIWHEAQERVEVRKRSSPCPQSNSMMPRMFRPSRMSVMASLIWSSR